MVLKKGEITVVGVYRHFKCFEGENIRSNFDRMMLNLSMISSQSSNIIVVGDFNVDPTRDYNSYYGQKLEEWKNNNIYDQLIGSDTRIRMVNGTMQKLMIDLVYTNMNEVRSESEFMNLSDHNLLKIKIGCSEPKDSYVRKGTAYLDWRKYSARKMNNAFVSLFRGINIHEHDVDDINDKITTAICLALNQLVPKRQANITGNNPVISPEIRNLRNRKSRLFKKWKKSGDIEDFNKLRQASNELNYEVKMERKKILHNAINGTSKEYWGAINKVLGKSIVEDMKIMDNGREVRDSMEVANLFSEFFRGKVEELDSRSECVDFEVPDLQGIMNESEYFKENDVENAIECLKNSKAMGLDEVPGMIIKHLKKVIIRPLCWLFNNIVDTGKIPKAWKISKIIPIHKKGAKNLVTNYRPVSNISSLSKVFERCIIEKLRVIGDDIFVGDHQHAFRKGSSIVTAGLTVQDFLATELQDNKIVLAYSADLTAAFDLLRPKLLVKNLLELKVNPAMIRTIYNFLSDRSAFVQIGESTSFNWEIPMGCVQGSVLGPILFNIYMRKLPEIIKSVDQNWVLLVF